MIYLNLTQANLKMKRLFANRRMKERQKKEINWNCNKKSF